MAAPASSATDTARAGYPSRSYAWYVVVLLTIAYILSFVDRYVLGLLAGSIKQDLGLTDSQLGYLLGPAFAIFYATMGLPLGWLADRKRRTWIVGFGVALWSAATAASGLARNFLHLFIARMSVGVGEATLSPCAMSMIADSFPKEQRGKPIAFYTAALGLGAGLASLLSAAVLTWANSIQAIDLPWLGAVAPWQFTFLILGIPGVFFALLFFTLREPPRQRQTAAGNLDDMLRYVGRRAGVFASFVSVFCYMTIIAYSQGFLPLTFQRTWGWSPELYALVNGVTLIVVAPLAVNASGWMSDRLFAAGRRDAPLVIALVGVVIMLPTGVIAPLMPTGVSAFVVYGIQTIGIGMVSATGVTALLNITPDEIRAQTVALYYMCISLAGLLLGPTSVGWLNDLVFGEDGIRYSMALLPALFGLPVLMAAPLIRRLYLNEVVAREAAEAAS